MNNTYITQKVLPKAMADELKHRIKAENEIAAAKGLLLLVADSESYLVRVTRSIESLNAIDDLHRIQVIVKHQSQWTKDLPIDPGFYWFTQGLIQTKPNEGATSLSILHVHRHYGDRSLLMASTGEGEAKSIDEFKGWWKLIPTPRPPEVV